MENASHNTIAYADGVPALPHLKAWRERKGLTQQELADKAGVRAATVSDLERKGLKAHASTFRVLASALGISTEDLLDGPPQK